MTVHHIYLIPSRTHVPIQVWHTHAIPNVGYVLSRSITVKTYPKGISNTLYAVDILPETMGALYRGITGDEPATLLVIMQVRKASFHINSV